MIGLVNAKGTRSGKRLSLSARALFFLLCRVGQYRKNGNPSRIRFVTAPVRMSPFDQIFVYFERTDGRTLRRMWEDSWPIDGRSWLDSTTHNNKSRDSFSRFILFVSWNCCSEKTTTLGSQIGIPPWTRFFFPPDVVFTPMTKSQRTLRIYRPTWIYRMRWLIIETDRATDHLREETQQQQEKKKIKRRWRRRL